MYIEENNNSKYTLRSLLIKIFMIVAIILILIWLVPKFLSYKKPNKETENVVVSTKISDDKLLELQEAGLKYFNKDNIPVESNNKIITLKKIQEKGIIGDIKNDGIICNSNDSYVKLTKNDNDYTLKSYLKCGASKKEITVNVGIYDYCSNTLLCLKQDIKENKDETVTKTVEPVEPIVKTKLLTDFTPWTEYQKASCDIKPITCIENDTNCLKEIKTYSRKEKVGTKETPMYTTHTALKLEKTTNVNACSNYNYVVISNVIFKTEGNYGEILSLNNKTTANWTYRGQISTSTTPYYGGNEYYKYIGTKDGLHYYDSYKYNYPMDKVTSYTDGCSKVENKIINIYTVYKQKEVYNSKQDVFATACYISTRTRSITYSK